jgi:hypothetical protein
VPGALLTTASTVQCQHGGTATATSPLPRVQAAGAPAVGQSSPYTVAGCPFVPPAPGPCVTAQWVVVATRVTSGGVPLVLQDSTAVCAPTGTGLQVAVVQQRVTGV